MNKVQKTITAVAALGAVAGITVAFNATRTEAWGDNGGGRPGYTKAQIESGVLGNKIVFNSITDGTFGDERNFVGARVDDGQNKGKENVWNANEITVESGKTYLVRLYVHNNSPKGYDAVAQNVKATFALSKNYATSNAITGYIDSSNATPTQYWDSVVFKSANGQKFYLDYVEGSALVENNGYAKGGNGAKLSDSIITSTGVTLGYDKAGDGKIPGCYQYSQFVTIKVKPVFTDENYIVEKTVRKAGTTDSFVESLTANVGDVVEYQIHYKNTTEAAAENVSVIDTLPTNMEVASAPVLYNKTTGKNGLKLDDFTKKAVSIGGYGINAEGYVRFTAKVVDKDLVCGKNTLRNWAQVGVAKVTLQDSADVVVNKTCETPKILKTRWILEDGTVLKDWTEGTFPDKEGDDYPQYDFVKYTTDGQGWVTNIYKKKEEQKVVKTRWILEDGTVLKDWTEGSFPDKEGDDYPEYIWVKTTIDENGWVTNVYKKKTTPTPTPQTCPEGYTLIDGVCVAENKFPDDPTPEQLPTTGPVTVSALGAGSIVTLLGYFISSRRK